LSRASPRLDPLPTTRELAEKYGVNNSTVFRHLARYEAEGLLWRSPRGRFYDARARLLVDRPRPLACLFRRIENWSFLYQELMEGVASACEEEGCATLLWHDEHLVRHSEVGSPPQFASTPAQIKSLESFFDQYGDSIGGVILDHAWTDKALSVIPAKLRERSVLLCRPGPLDLNSVYPDMVGSASSAIAQLLEMGCQEIHPIRPFKGDPAVDFSLSCIAAAEKSAPCKLAIEVKADTAAERTRLLERIEREGKPAGLISPEDNIADLLLEEKRRRKYRLSQILSIQGTRHTSDVARIRNDYADIGRRAVRLITSM
jgi:DNA-binding LacI/PurR family transcriptional regulator